MVKVHQQQFGWTSTLQGLFYEVWNIQAPGEILRDVDPEKFEAGNSFHLLTTDASPRCLLFLKVYFLFFLFSLVLFIVLPLFLQQTDSMDLSH